MSTLEVAPSLAHHIALVALARVEGVSPSNYLNDRDKIEIQRITKKILRQSSADVSELFN
jgi:hypothetical protein